LSVVSRLLVSRKLPLGCHAASVMALLLLLLLLAPLPPLLAGLP
jgi:hypothetical protein